MRLALLAFVVKAALAAMGLSTTTADIRVENVVPGTPVELGAAGFTVINRGDEAVRVKVEPLSPAPESLLEDYEPLPDTAWVRVSPEAQAAAAGETVESELRVAVPEDRLLAGRRFLAHLWARTTGAPVGVGVLSRLRIETAPAQVRIAAVDGAIEVVNSSGPAKTLDLEVRAAAAPGGWTAGRPEALRLASKRVRLKAGAKATVAFECDETAGRLAFLVVATSKGRPEAAGWIKVRADAK